MSLETNKKKQQQKTKNKCSSNETEFLNSISQAYSQVLWANRQVCHTNVQTFYSLQLQWHFDAIKAVAVET